MKSTTSRSPKKKARNTKVPGMGARIKHCREAKDMSVNELGRRIGRTGGGISRFEREERVPTIAILAQIAAALDCSIDYLVTGYEAIPRKATISRRSIGDNWTELHVSLGQDGLTVIAK